MGERVGSAGAELDVEMLEEGTFSVDDYCDFTGLSRADTYRQMAAGKLPFVLHGKRRLIPRKAAKQLLARGLQGGHAA